MLEFVRLARSHGFYLLALFKMAGPFAIAQSLTLGGATGGGAFGISSGGVTSVGQAAVEVCAFCSGRLGLFGEYVHWYSGNHPYDLFLKDRVRSADLAGAGVRIQSRRRVRWFADIGAVAGRDRHTTLYGGATGGLVTGTGVEIPLRRHWYLRPQFRGYVLSPHSIEGLGVHWIAAGSVGAGYRF